MTQRLAGAVDVTGANPIGSRERRRGPATFTSSDPRTGRAGSVAFHEALESDLREAVTRAARAFAAWRSSASRATDDTDSTDLLAADEDGFHGSFGHG